MEKRIGFNELLVGLRIIWRTPELRKKMIKALLMSFGLVILEITLFGLSVRFLVDYVMTGNTNSLVFGYLLGDFFAKVRNMKMNIR